MLIRHTLFKARPKVGAFQLHPLTAGRVLVLEELGNPLGTGSDIEIDSRAVYEAFLVAILPGEELEAAVQDEDAWLRRVRVLSLEMSDDDLNAFWEIIQAELQAAAGKMTEAVEKPAPAAGKAGSRRKSEASRRIG